jgi:GNAT superfamily N-acetyltransferase
MATVDRIRPDDWPVLRAVRLAALTDAPEAFGSTLERELAFGDTDWQVRAAASAAGSERGTWLAREGDDVVGIVGGYVEGDAVELVSMWVMPKARGTGIAGSLVGRVLDWARDVGVSRVDLWVVRGNDRAQRCYESAGFELTTDHQPLPSDPCKDEVRMRRLLS